MATTAIVINTPLRAPTNAPITASLLNGFFTDVVVEVIVGSNVNILAALSQVIFHFMVTAFAKKH